MERRPRSRHNRKGNSTDSHSNSVWKQRVNSKVAEGSDKVASAKRVSAATRGIRRSDSVAPKDHESDLKVPQEELNKDHSCAVDSKGADSNCTGHKSNHSASDSDTGSEGDGEHEKPVPVSKVRKGTETESESKTEDSNGRTPVNLGSERYTGKRQLEIVSAICADSGFKTTGKPLKRHPADFFERSGLLKEFDKYLSGRLDKGCNLSKEETEIVLVHLRRKRETVPFLAGTISGVPGSGKTTLLRRIQTEAGLNSAVILGNPRHKVSFSNLPSCYTAKEILLLRTEAQFEVLLIDEYTLLTSGEILLLQRIVRASVVILFGDRAQGSSAYLGSPEWVQFPVIYQSDVSHRFGKSTASLCGKQGFDFKGGDHEDEVEECDYEGSSRETDINLVFTEKTANDLLSCGISSSLVEDVQGKEYNSVTLFVLECDREKLADTHLRSVAFTRHKTLLVIRIEKSLFLQLINGELVSDYQPKTYRYGKE
nr:triple gene block protein 1 [Beet virus Q]